jgi:hypothetical protein
MTTITKPTANWSKLGTRFYRRIPLYTQLFDPDLDLTQHLIAGASYAGAIAFARNGERVAAYRGEEHKAGVDVYSTAGKLIQRVPWDGGSEGRGEVRGLGWSESEGLVVVGEDGGVRYFEGLGGDFVPFSLGHVSSGSIKRMYEEGADIGNIGRRRAWCTVMPLLVSWIRGAAREQPSCCRQFLF